jgi:hypothetical protein
VLAVIFLRQPSRLDKNLVRSHGLDPDQTGGDQWPISGDYDLASHRADAEQVGIEAEMADTP